MQGWRFEHVRRVQLPRQPSVAVLLNATPPRPAGAPAAGRRFLPLGPAQFGQSPSTLRSTRFGPRLRCRAASDADMISPGSMAQTIRSGRRRGEHTCCTRGGPHEKALLDLSQPSPLPPRPSPPAPAVQYRGGGLAPQASKAEGPDLSSSGPPQTRQQRRRPWPPNSAHACPPSVVPWQLATLRSFPGYGG